MKLYNVTIRINTEKMHSPPSASGFTRRRESGEVRVLEFSCTTAVMVGQKFDLTVSFSLFPGANLFPFRNLHFILCLLKAFSVNIIKLKCILFMKLFKAPNFEPYKGNYESPRKLLSSSTKTTRKWNEDDLTKTAEFCTISNRQR